MHRGPAEVDASALLVALVLVPHSYPRNRFFTLFQEPAARRVRRRAALIRSVVLDLSGEAVDLRLSRERRPGGRRVWLRYHLADVGVERSTLLDETELAVLKVALDRGRPRSDLAADEDALEMVHALLRRLYEPS